jgi:predicted DNA-binding transcriptional regulator YafY
MDEVSLGLFGLFLASLAGPASIAADQMPAEVNWAARFHFDADKWYWTDEGRQLVTAVLDAMSHSALLQIDYRSGRSGSSQSHEVAPYGLVWKGGSCYLAAQMQDGAMRSFRLDRVQQVTQTERRFTFPVEGFDMRTWWHQSLEEFGKGDTRVTLRGSGHGANRLRSLSLKSTSRLEDHANGDVVISLYVDNWDWLIPLACQFGDQVEVVEPAELRAAVVDRLSGALRVYSRDPEMP